MAEPVPGRSHENVFGGATPVADHHLAPIGATGGSGGRDESPGWKAILEDVPQALFLLDSAQQLVFENSRCAATVGLPIRKAGGIESWLSELCPDPEHADKVLRSWHEHIWANQTTRVFSLRRPDQKLREIEFRSTLRADGGLAVVFEDVTDRLHEEEKHQHGRRKFRALFENADNGAVLVDQTGRIVEANPAFVSYVGITAGELRMSHFSGLVNPRNFADFERLLSDSGTEISASVPIRLRCREGEKSAGLRYHSIGEPGAGPSLGLILVDPDAKRERDLLRNRLANVRHKAQALLSAVPDLILLVDSDLRIGDFAPPPTPWPDFEIPDSWRGQLLRTAWPVLGTLLENSRAEIERGATVRAEIGGGSAEAAIREITAAPAGDGEILVVVRRKEIAPPAPETIHREAPEAPEAPIGEELPSPLAGEKKRHNFRNQLQLVTSLFSLEPQGAAARDAFLRWQIRLRSLALAVPVGSEQTIALADMIRGVADEVCSITAQGPGRRSVVVAGSSELRADATDASLLALFSGELMRLVLGTAQHGRGPAIIFDLERDSEGNLGMNVRSGEGRRFVSADEDSEIEILDLLAAQMRGKLRFLPSPDRKSGGDWILSAPILLR